MDLPARIGKPTDLVGLKEKIEDPIYATAVGLLRYAVSPEGMLSESRTTTTNNSSKARKFLERVKEFIREIL
jgi:cell division protein FtsA